MFALTLGCAQGGQAVSADGGTAGSGPGAGGSGGTRPQAPGSGGSGSGGTGGGAGGAAGGAGGAVGGAGGMVARDGGAPPATGGTSGAPGIDASMMMPPVASRPCKGSRQNPSGQSAVVLRSDMTIRRLVTLPGNVTRLAQDPLSKSLFFLQQNGTVHRVDLASNGTATTAMVFTPQQIGLASGAESLGMAFGPDGTLYIVSHLPQAVSPMTSKATIFKGAPAAGGARAWAKLAETAAYPRSKTYYDHEWSGIVASTDGKYVYVNSGSRTDHGEIQTTGGAFPNTREVALTASIFRIPTSANGLVLPNDEGALRTMGLLFAQGTRNSYDLELAPWGDLLAGDNGPDADYHEELNWLREGRHYGFPWRLGNEDNEMQFPTYDPAKDKRLQPEFGAVNMGTWRNDPAYPPKPAGLTLVDPIPNTGPDADELRNPATGAVEKASATGKPYATYSDHGSPLGLTFDRGQGALCADFSGGAFILRFGKAAGKDFERGRDLLHLKLTKTGETYTLAATQIARGFSSPIDAVLIAEKMYVLDHAAPEGGQGALWEIALPTGN